MSQRCHAFQCFFSMSRLRVQVPNPPYTRLFSLWGVAAWPDPVCQHAHKTWFSPADANWLQDERRWQTRGSMVNITKSLGLWLHVVGVMWGLGWWQMSGWGINQYTCCLSLFCVYFGSAADLEWGQTCAAAFRPYSLPPGLVTLPTDKGSPCSVRSCGGATADRDI